MAAEAGWYPDPDLPTRWRWYDGDAWTEYRFSPAGPMPSAPGRPTGSHRSVVRLLVGAAAAVLLVVAIVVAVGHRPPLKFTLDGNQIDNANQALHRGEVRMAAVVHHHHGATLDSSRCYFAVDGHAQHNAISDRMFCGPVRFVDGSARKPFLTLPLTASATNGNGVSLEVGSPGGPARVVAAPAHRQLRRPDRKSPPPGNGGLKAPPPPPLAKHFAGVVRTSTAMLEDAPSDARMASLHGGIAIDHLGSLKRVGHGQTARRAPPGEDLLAAQLTDLDGENETSTGVADLEVQIGHHRPQAVNTDGIDLPYHALAVAVSKGTAAYLVMELDGFTQRLSLRNGHPGPKNITVLRRTVDQRNIHVDKSMAMTPSDHFEGQTQQIPVTIKVGWVGLAFFLGRDKHPADPRHAYLVLDLTYDWPPGTPDDVGLEPGAFKLAYGTTTKVAVNLASQPDKILVGFEVPGDFRSGKLIIGGVDQESSGDVFDFGSQTFTVPLSFPS